jgi:hypothetical protein
MIQTECRDWRNTKLPTFGGVRVTEPSWDDELIRIIVKKDHFTFFDNLSIIETEPATASSLVN